MPNYFKHSACTPPTFHLFRRWFSLLRIGASAAGLSVYISCLGNFGCKRNKTLMSLGGCVCICMVNCKKDVVFMRTIYSVSTVCLGGIYLLSIVYGKQVRTIPFSLYVCEYIWNATNTLAEFVQLDFRATVTGDCIKYTPLHSQAFNYTQWALTCKLVETLLREATI